METLKPNPPCRGRAALLATACLIVPLLGGEPLAGSSLAESEVSRRGVAIDEARELLRKGDEAYTAGRYAEAVEAYGGARDLIPNAPVSAELRSAATARYAQASVEQARVLSRNGDVAAAKAAVDKVLKESVAPDNPGALAFRAQLDDPIRTNPALTAEHAKDVDSVRRLLYTAQGAFNLGKFDEAGSTYKDVLRIDPTNTAARRGMEQVASAKSGYHQSAYDQARAEMLGQVESQWEQQVPAPEHDPALVDPASTGTDASFVSVKNKLDRIMIPKLALEQASLEEALDFLRLRASENDTLELEPARKGVNFAVNLGAPDSAAATKIRKVRFDLQLAHVPLSLALKYITDITHTSFTTDDFSVIIAPTGSSSAELVSRTYRVPPDFISSMSTGSAGTAAAVDPFGAAPANEGLLPKRLGAQEALANQGVAFPQGASASYTPANNTLRIVNTALNQDFISQIIETLTKTEPVMVAVRVTMIKVAKTRLEELGFDWIVNPFALDRSLFASGGTTGNQGGRTGADFISPVNNTSVDGIPSTAGQNTTNGVTNGLRSGDQAINSNSIDDLINNSSRGAQKTSVAPGVLSVTGLFTDGQVQALMRGLDQKKGVDLMAQPSVVTRSGQASNIAIVREFLYATEYEPPELPNSTGLTTGGTTPVTPATPTAFQKKDVGVTLDVLPVADANKQFITVTLNPTFSDFDGFVNYGSPINSTQQGIFGPETVEITKNAIVMPVFSKQTLSTTVDVADGATVVVGGLMTESVQNVEDQTPVLGSLPIVGRLFQSKARQTSTTAIIFLVNVELMDPTGRRYKDR